MSISLLKKSDDLVSWSVPYPLCGLDDPPPPFRTFPKIHPFRKGDASLSFVSLFLLSLSQNITFVICLHLPSVVFLSD